MLISVLSNEGCHLEMNGYEFVVENNFSGLRGPKAGFFGHFFVNSGAKKTKKISLKLSTSEARSNFCSIFLGFYYLKHEKN